MSGKQTSKSAVEKELGQVASAVLEMAAKAGAGQAAVKMSRSRFTDVGFRDGRLEKATSSTRQNLALTLYWQGRYALHTTSDLRPDALKQFVTSAAKLTAALEPDPLRSLADPARLAKPPAPELELFDPKLEATSPTHYIDMAREMENLTRATAAGGEPRLVSAMGGAYAEIEHQVLATSDGFVGAQQETGAFAVSQLVFMEPGSEGKRRMGWWYQGARHLAELESQETLKAIAQRCRQRALDQMGARPGPSGVFPVVVENQAAAKLVGQLLSAMTGRALHQKRSYLAHKLDQVMGAPLLTIQDQPLIKGGFGSRWYDGEGVAAAPLTLVDKGVLKHFYLDTYHARSLKLPPTTGSSSNVVLPASHALDGAGLAGQMDQGLLVTGFLGGNFNSTTGDFSLGVQGSWMEKGRTVHAVEGMNMAGNFEQLWSRLAGVGNDPFPYTATRAPSLMFAQVQLAGKAKG